MLEKYDGSPLPNQRIAQNVLEEMGVPAEATERVFELIVHNAESVGFIKRIKDKTYVDLGLSFSTVHGTRAPTSAPATRQPGR